MYVFFQKWNCFGIVPFQDNMQFNSHSFDSISCQFVIPPQFTLKVENSRIIAIQTFQFQCPDTYIHVYIYIHTYITCTYIHVYTYIHTYMHTYIHTYIHAYIHTYIHTYMRMYVHTYVRTYIYTYAYTYCTHMLTFM